VTYRAPVKDMLFTMKELAGLDELTKLPGFEAAGEETAATVLAASAALAEEVVAPLNVAGDKNPSSFKDGQVSTTPGFKAAFQQYVEGGWQGLQHPPALGGQGLPKLISAACMEMLDSANLSFALCPLLTDGAIEALLVAGSPELQQAYVPNLIAGKWTGTMNLTEPQAGSDLALVNTRAEPRGDGAYRLSGTKVFITYGEHDLAENIIHLVLARVVGAPEGVKGLSLFVCPKVLADGTKNDVHCVSIEHKLGIKASPTAVLQFGDADGAVAYMVGKENRGLEYMFVMMNAARYAVGLQGVGLAERAYQGAAAYARERLQGRPVDGSLPGAGPIINHPDVRRMLLTMRALTEGSRAMALVAAGMHDVAHAHPDEAVRAKNQAGYEFLVPLVKGFATEMSVEVASLGIQVRGGAGYIEESGAPQFLRDARILPIYEGTTAIQANDLVGRKTMRDGGKTARALMAETEAALQRQGGEAALAVSRRLGVARGAFLEVVDFVLQHGKSNPNAVFAGAVPYLMQTSQLVVGWQLARALLAAERRLAQGDEVDFMRAKVVTARFYADHVLSLARSWRDRVVEGASSIIDFPLDAY